MMSSVPGYFFKGDLDKNFGYFVNKEVGVFQVPSRECGDFLSLYGLISA